MNWRWLFTHHLRLPRVRQDRDLIKASVERGERHVEPEGYFRVTGRWWKFKGCWRRRLFGWRGWSVYY